MELQKSRIAMVSPSRDAYSETFIQAQKNGLRGEVFYYFEGTLPANLEHKGKLLTDYIFLYSKIKQKIGFSTFQPSEVAFIKSLKENKIQVVFAQYGTTASRIVKICKYLEIPIITHFHGYDASVKSVIEKCKGYQEVFDYSTYVIAVSISMKEKLIALGCSEDKVVYNTYGPDPLFLSLNPKFSTDTFIAVGRFVEKKAPYYTILAFSKVLKQYPNAKLIIGGNGSLYEVCKNLIQYLNIENNVLLPGVLSRVQFLDYLHSSIAFVQHSVTSINGDQEGTPVAVLEASAAGLPVISTNHAGIPDVIIDGETGFLVDEHDVDAMAKKMILILGNKELAMQLGKNGKERIKTHFTMEKHLQIIDELINDVIKKNE